MMLEQIVERLHSIIRNHFRSFYSDLDVVQDLAQPANSGANNRARSGFRHHNPHYLIAAFLFASSIGYGIIGPAVEKEPSGASLKQLLASKYQLMHALFPRPMWAQIEMIVVIASTTIVSVLVQFYFQTPVPRKALISTMAASDHKVPSANLAEILMMRHRLNKLQSHTVPVLHIASNVYAFTNLIRNEAYSIRLDTVLFWAIGTPVLTYYVFTSLFVAPFYLILAGIYVRIQQRSIQLELQVLNRLLASEANKNNNKRRFNMATQRHQLYVGYYKFIKANARLLIICHDLNAYAAFWSRYITIICGAFIAIECYLIYALFLVQMVAYSKVLFGFILVDIVGLHFMLILQCARVVKWNGRIHRENRKFLVNFCKNKQDGLSPKALLKIESLQHSRTLHGYAFRVLGNRRITSNTFYYMLSYISIFFMYIVKEQYKLIE